MTIDLTTLDPARTHDFLLGGSNDVEVDRQVAGGPLPGFRYAAVCAWTNLELHRRATRWLAEQTWSPQLVDIGSGLPTQIDAHTVVHRL